jgi:alpha-tubulin suppressor-like RCC1 family protein
LNIVGISCGDYHAAAIDGEGNLYTWGGGKNSQYNKGQCGHGNTDFCDKPKRVEALSHKRVQKVSCGPFHTLVITEDREAYAFGSS